MYGPPTALYICWAVPEDDGGAPITTYKVSLTPNGQATVEHLVEAPLQCYSDNSLVHGITVQATVKASNDGGQTYGPEFVFPLIVPLAAPSAPPASAEAVALEPGTASITWTPPEVAAEGNPYYSVISKSSNPNDPTVGFGTDFMNLSGVLTGLNPESEYSFTVEVINQVGRSPAAITNTIVFSPPAPPSVEPIDATQYDALPMAPPITEEEPLLEGYTEAPAEAPAEAPPTE